MRIEWRSYDFWHVLVGLLAIGLFLGVVFWQSSYLPRVDRVAPRGVALLDELSVTNANPDFVEQMREIVEREGLWFRYYGPEEVTVRLFGVLPALGYEFVIIRAHSTGWSPGDQVTIFTSEQYEQGKHASAQLDGLIQAGNVGGGSYFTVTSAFVRASLGSFPGTIVVMMGCTGLKNFRMASAFVDKGAGAYVGWDDAVYAHRTDAAVLALMRGLFESGLPLAEAVSHAMTQVGEDTAYYSSLRFYPTEAGNLDVWEQRSVELSSASEVSSNGFI